jgi:hypothetical protein
LVGEESGFGEVKNNKWKEFKKKMNRKMKKIVVTLTTKLNCTMYTKYNGEPITGSLSVPPLTEHCFLRNQESME